MATIASYLLAWKPFLNRSAYADASLLSGSPAEAINGIVANISDIPFVATLHWCAESPSCRLEAGGGANGPWWGA